MLKSGQNGAREQVELGTLLKGGASIIALAAFSVAAPASAQVAQGSATVANSSDEDPETTEAGADAAEQDASGDAPGAGAESDGEIVVTGIRQSLRSSQDIKRNADVVVDSVTAEDIGALPDRSVTEALQRIPGVAIDRFSAGRDPDHFSAEGSGVVVRGLTYVRSELNGRDTFTANNGRGLSFSDVPSELLGGVDVFKSPSADMIEGGIAGTVNLRTRLPFDNKGLVVAGSGEYSWGDLRREARPTISILASNRWETGAGEFGLLGSFTRSEVAFRSDAVQVSNFGRRTLFTNGDVIQTGTATPVGGAACTTGTQASCVFVPRGAVMRTQDTDRLRYGYSAAAQWRSPDRSILATLQFLRSDSREAWTERAIEVSTDNVSANGDSRAVPGTTLEFDDSGLFDKGVITGPTGWRDDQQNTAAWGGNGDVRTPRFGLQSNNQRRDVDQRFVTSDIGANVRWNATDRLTLNVDYQHVDSEVENLDATLWTSSFMNAFIDLNGNRIPTIEFRPPEVCSGPSKNSPCTDLAGGASDQNPSYFGLDATGKARNSFSDPYNSFFRNVMDHTEDSEGNEDAFRFDVDYDFEEGGWLESVRAGARYSHRENIARFSTYNWGVLSEIWGGRGPVWLDDPVDGVTGGNGGAPIGGVETFSFPGFMRGKAGDPQLGDPRLFYASNTVKDYEGLISYAKQIVQEWKAGPYNQGCNSLTSGWGPLRERSGVLPETSPFCPAEVNPVEEENRAAYVMARFAQEFDNGISISGNIGLRYTKSKRTATGFQAFTATTFTSDQECLNPPKRPDGSVPPTTPFCALPAEVRAQARAFSNGALEEREAKLSYDYVLPSLNIKAEFGGGVQARFAWYNGISPPEFGLTRNFANLSLSTSVQDIEAGSGRPIIRTTVGNPFLQPIESTNFDASLEWYFDDVGQLTFAAFHKRLNNVLTNGVERRPFTNNGATFEAIVTTPTNSDDTGKITGFELAYQQTYDFLPGFLAGFGLNATYTYVKSKGVSQSTLSETDPDVGAGTQANIDTSLLPLQGLSKHTINFTPFYERGPLSIRLSYNWRSRFLLTTRDVIVPFAPILNEPTGQLDGSIFFSINDNIRVGVQAVNLLNEITRTSQVIEASTADGIRRAPRSWFMQDRRFSAVLRATF